MKKIFKAKNTHIIVKRFLEDQDKFNYGEDYDIDKLKFLDGQIISMGKNVDLDEYKIGDIIHTAEFVASPLGNEFYAVDVNDVMCQIIYEEQKEVITMNFRNILKYKKKKHKHAWYFVRSDVVLNVNIYACRYANCKAVKITKLKRIIIEER